MKLRICRSATVPFFLHHHLRSQIQATVAAGHDVTLISSDGPEMSALRQSTAASFCMIDMARTISPWRDIRSLWRLYRHFRHARYDIVHSTTPKAGLLCAVAGWLANVPIRLHTFTGQPWVELHGMTRVLAKAADWLTARLNTMNFADSSSQRDFLVSMGVCRLGKVSVIGSGSLAGVDVRRFDRGLVQRSFQNMREHLAIADDAIVIVFVGRLVRDKGVVELVHAHQALRKQYADLKLVLVGPQEPDRDPLPAEVIQMIEQDDSIFSVGYTDQPEAYLVGADIFCLPSYREGFGNVVIEAAAVGVPAVGTDIVGLRDAIVHEKTGLLVPAKNVEALKNGLARMLEDSTLRQYFGEQAHARATSLYDCNSVNQLLLDEYEMLAKKCLKNKGNTDRY